MSRSIKKGPFVDKNLFKKVQAATQGGNKQFIKCYSRASTIIPEMVGLTINVHNGKTFIPVYVQDNMIGHKLGEFAPTRMFRMHGGVAKSEPEKG
ncbi:MAG: 30S ribosomal protein S19 [Spirochaetes bacterium]|nr:30S ribosomal protein S19 [Spirochaetota bacterium]